MRRSRFLLFGLVLGVVLFVLTLGGGCSDQEKRSRSTVSEEHYVLDEAYGMIQENVIYPVQGEQLVEGALRGMADVIGDPYSTYLSKEEAASHRESLAGERVGIGAEVTRSNGKYMIVAPVKGSPAEKAGLQPYDEIVQINGERVGDLSFSDVVKKLRGKKGSAVTLTIYRPTATKHITLTIMRDVIPVQTVSFEKMTQRGETFGYIALTMFGDESAKEWKKATDHLLKEGANGLIIDVRGNPGGYLRAVGSIVGSLLGEDTVFAYMQDPKGYLTPLVVDPADLAEFDARLQQMPIVVLQDKGSASASEVLSGALKDLRRGFLVGTNSFGKGTVQDTMDLSNGGEMKLSTHKWLTPTEKWIHGVGVEADLKVEQNKLFTEQVRMITDVYAVGAYHDHIAYAQRILKELGYPIERIDGYFDEQTGEAVSAFRTDAEVEVDNVMDRKFFAALKEKVETYRKDLKNDAQLQMAIGYLLHEMGSK